MKKIAIYIAFLLPLFLVISCVFNDKMIKEESNITISGQKYTHIVLTNESDTVNGYYYVLNDSLFFLSKADYERYESFIDTYPSFKDDINPYFLFSLNSQEPFLSELKMNTFEAITTCPDFRDLRNIFYPPQKLNDSLYIFEQQAVMYGKTDPYIRIFVVTKDLKIKSFSTEGKKSEYYFFYD